MASLRPYKEILFGLVIIVLLFIAYSLYFGGEEEGALTTTGSQNAASAAEREIVSLLRQLEAVELDATLFNDPVFRQLQDFSRTIDPQPIGRNNPFAPF
jgi:hypothetical protein